MSKLPLTTRMPGHAATQKEQKSSPCHLSPPTQVTGPISPCFSQGSLGAPFILSLVLQLCDSLSTHTHPLCDDLLLSLSTVTEACKPPHTYTHKVTLTLTDMMCSHSHTNTSRHTLTGRNYSGPRKKNKRVRSNDKFALQSHSGSL